MIIYSISGSVILDAPVTSSAELVQELMQSDYVQLSWNSDTPLIIPAGAYVLVKGEKYSLIEPYTPSQKNEAQYEYKPQFHSSFFGLLSKVPFFMYNGSGASATKEADWTLTDSPDNFMRLLSEAIYKETGIKYRYSVDNTNPITYATVVFNCASILSASNQIANAFETELWLEKFSRADSSGNIGRLHLSKATFGNAQTLEVGVNVKVPTVTKNTEYFNRFYVFGSTRNIEQDYQGANVNALASKRLTLDPSDYPNGYIDYSNGDPVYSKVLQFDDVYPAATDLVVTNIRARLKYRLDEETHQKIIVGMDGDLPVYEQYAVWYMQLKRKVGSRYIDFEFNNTTYNKDDNPSGMLLPGLPVSFHFNSGSLNGREFEIIYHESQKQVKDEADVGTFTILAGDFEIKYVEEGGLIVPSITGLSPATDDKVILFNVHMPSSYTNDAYARLELAALTEIRKNYIDENTGLPVDKNQYQFASDPTVFIENEPELTVGSAVTYVNGSYSKTSRVTAIRKRLDLSCYQTITIGDDIVKGNIQELKEEAVSANRNIDLLAALNKSTAELTAAYERTHQLVLQQLADSASIWMREPYLEGGVTKYRAKLNPALTGAFAEGFITAGGIGSGGGGGGGIDLDRVWESLTNNTDKPNVKINVAHIPNLEINNINGLSAALADAGKVKKVQVGSGNPVEPDLNGIIKLPAYLQLSGGTMTGGITMPSGGSSVSNTKGLMFTDNCSITTSTNNNMAIRSQGKVYITSRYGTENQKGILIDGDTFTYGDQTIYHAGNLTVGVLTGLLGNTYHPYLGSSSLAFTARTLTITADVAIAHIAFQRASANYITAPENGSLNFVIGKSSIGSSLATLRLESDNVTVNGYGTPGILNIVNTNNNRDAGSIFFSSGNWNGFKISSVYKSETYYGRQSLVFYRSNNTSGSAPYEFTPIELMRLTYNGRVGINNEDPAYTLDVSGVTRVTSLKIGDGTPELSWDANNNAWKLTGNLYATGFITAGGVGSGGGGGGGADLLDVWVSLRDNNTTDEYYNWKVNAGHIPLGTGFTIDSAGRINVASVAPTEITLTGVVTGTGTTTINTSIADNALTIAKTNGLQAALDGRVSNVTYSSEQLHVTKGGNTTDLTIAFATYARRLKRINGTSEAGGYNLNTLLDGGGITSQYTSTGYWANAPAGMSYGSAIEINNGGGGSLSAQLAWDINHNSETPTRRMWWRARSSSHGWQNDWHLIYDSSTLTKAVITGLLGTEYHPYLGNTSLDFSAKALTLNGALTGATTGNFSSVLTADRLVLTNTSMVSHISFGRDSANYITAPTGGTIAFVPNGITVGAAGAILWVRENSVMVKGPSLSTPGVLKIMNNTSNADAGEILFQSYANAYSPDTTPQNGFRIAAEGASYRRQSLNFYCSDNREGDYSPIWRRAMRISYTGNVIIGNTTDGSEFFPTLYSYGNFQVGYSSNAATMKVFGRSTLAGGIAIGTSTNAQSDYLEWDERNRAWHLKGNLYADGFITSGGVGAGEEEEGATLLTVWRSLTNNPYLVDSDITATTKIAAAHIPVGSGLQVVNGVINAIGQVESVVGLTGVINQSQLRTALGLGSLAYRNNITKSYITDFPTAVSAFTNDAGYITSAAIPTNVSSFTNDAGYITGITLTGVVTGSGTTIINTSIADNALTIAKTNGLQAALDGRVSNVTYSSEQLHVTKGGNTTDLTIAFATYTRRLKRINGTSEAGGYNLNTLLNGGGITSQYSSTSYWANAPTGMSYAGAAMEIATGTTSLSAQVAWDINHNSETPTRRMWWRARSSSHDWQNDWHLIYDSSTLTKAVITGLLGTEYHPYGGSSSLSILADAVSAATVSASGTGTFKNIVLTDTASTARIEFSRSGLNYIQIPSDGKLAIVANSSRTDSNSTAIFSATAVNPGVSGAIALGYYSESSSGSQLWSNISAYGMQLVKSGGATLYIRNHTGNGDAGSIIFRSSYGEQSNGFKIAAEAQGSYQRQTLNFYCSNNTSGSSPYTPVWQRAMRISYNGNVIIGNSTSGSEFYPTLYSYGNFQVGLSGNAATMDVYGAATLRSTLDVAGATSLSSTLSVSGATTLSNTLTVSGATTLNSTLSVAGAITLTGTSSSTAVINFSRAGANYITTPESGTLNIVTNGRTKTIANSTMIVGVDDVTVQGATMTIQGVGAPGVLNIFNNTNNASAGSIFFSSYNRNGFKISSVYTANACRQSLVFYRSNNETSPFEFTPIELMRLTHTGRVGINNESPAYTLDVTGTVRATALRLGDGAPEMVWDGANNAWRLKGNFYADGFVSAGGLGNSDNAVLVTLAGTQTITGAKTFSGTTTFTGAIRLRNTVTIGTSSTSRAVTLYGTLSVSSSLTAGAVSIVDDGGYPLISSANNRLYLQDSQDLVLTTGNSSHTVIGTYVSPGTYKLYVNGMANATRWDTSSDCRLKKDRVAIDNVWDVLLKLQPKEWIWNHNSNLDGQKGAGFIAQEVEPILPFAVHGTDYKTLDYTAFHAYEIAGLQDHESRIKALEKENKELKEKVKQLEMR